MHNVPLEEIQRAVLQAVDTDLQSATRGKEGQEQIKKRIFPFVEELARSQRQRKSSWMGQWKELDAILAQNSIPPSFLLTVVNTVMKVMAND